LSGHATGHAKSNPEAVSCEGLDINLQLEAGIRQQLRKKGRSTT
jgi:hypothetical protein